MIVVGVQELQQGLLRLPVVLCQELRVRVLGDVRPQAADSRLQEPETQVFHDHSGKEAEFANYAN